MVVDVVQNPQKSNVYEYEKKHVRCVGVYSGIIYGCVRYVLRVARVHSGCTVFSFSKIKPKIRVLLYTYMFDRAFGIFSSFCFSTAAAAAAVGGAASFCTYTKFSFSFSV